MGSVTFFDRQIDLAQTYYVMFADAKRQLTPEQVAKYRRISMWPSKLQEMLLAKLPPEENPNITPMTGKQLIEFSAQGYIPIFDLRFQESRKLTLMPSQAIDFYLEHSKTYGKG
jgi:hypothetical protein